MTNSLCTLIPFVPNTNRLYTCWVIVLWKRLGNTVVQHLVSPKICLLQAHLTRLASNVITQSKTGSRDWRKTRNLANADQHRARKRTCFSKRDNCHSCNIFMFVVLCVPVALHLKAPHSQFNPQGHTNIVTLFLIDPLYSKMTR